MSFALKPEILQGLQLRFLAGGNGKNDGLTAGNGVSAGVQQAFVDMDFILGAGQYLWVPHISCWAASSAGNLNASVFLCAETERTVKPGIIDISGAGSNQVGNAGRARNYKGIMLGPQSEQMIAQGTMQFRLGDGYYVPYGFFLRCMTQVAGGAPNGSIVGFEFAYYLLTGNCPID